MLPLNHTRQEHGVGKRTVFSKLTVECTGWILTEEIFKDAIFANNKEIQEARLSERITKLRVHIYKTSCTTSRTFR